MLMMKVDAMQESDKRVWLDRSSGTVINVDRAFAESDRTMRKRAVERDLLAAANGGERRWFVLATAKHAEKDVNNSLKHAGVEAWLPLKKGMPKRRLGRLACSRTAVLMPAFPGYLFVCVSPSAATWAGLDALKGVAGVLGTAEHPIPVSDGIVSKLRRMIDDGELDRTVAAKRLKKGDRVTIKDGPFAWFEGVMDGYAGTAHVRVLAAIFGRVVPVTLELAQIAKSD